MHQTVVGLHVRRTDYARWRGGKYFFSVDQYRKVITRLRVILPNCAVLLVSDDLDAARTLSKEPYCFLGPGTPVEDLHCLSLCDYILGPPSTFSSWAARYSVVNQYESVDPDYAFTLDSFGGRRLSEECSKFLHLRICDDMQFLDDSRLYTDTATIFPAL